MSKINNWLHYSKFFKCYIIFTWKGGEVLHISEFFSKLVEMFRKRKLRYYDNIIRANSGDCYLFYLNLQINHAIY